MKAKYTFHPVVAAAILAPAAMLNAPAQEFKAEAQIELKPGAKIEAQAEAPGGTANSSGTVTLDSSGIGRATITVDNDGKKETRVIEFDAKKPDEAKKQIELELKRKPDVRADLRAWVADGPTTILGVVLDEGNSDDPKSASKKAPLEDGTGLIVGDVMRGCPAEKAGLKKGDVLARLDDQILIAPQQLITLVRQKKEGDKVKLVYFRDGQKQETEATLAKRDDDGKKEPLDEVRRALGSAGLNVDDLLKKLNTDGIKGIIKSRIIKVGPDGKIEITEDKDGAPMRRLDLGDLPDRVKELAKKEGDFARDEAGRVKGMAKMGADLAGVEAIRLKDEVMKLKDEFKKVCEQMAKVQEENARTQKDTLEKLGQEMKRVQEAAAEAREAAKKAFQESLKNSAEKKEQ